MALGARVGLSPEAISEATISVESDLNRAITKKKKFLKNSEKNKTENTGRK